MAKSRQALEKELDTTRENLDGQLSIQLESINRDASSISQHATNLKLLISSYTSTSAQISRLLVQNGSLTDAQDVRNARRLINKDTNEVLQSVNILLSELETGEEISYIDSQSTRSGFSLSSQLQDQNGHSPMNEQIDKPQENLSNHSSTLDQGASSVLKSRSADKGQPQTSEAHNQGEPSTFDTEIQNKENQPSSNRGQDQQGNSTAKHHNTSMNMRQVQQWDATIPPPPIYFSWLQ